MDPFNSLVQSIHAQDLIFLHRYEDAEAVLLRTLEREPGAPYALSTLRTAYHLLERDPNMPSLGVDPIFDLLRDEPRFETLLDGLGFPQ